MKGRGREGGVTGRQGGGGEGEGTEGQDGQGEGGGERGKEWEVREGGERDGGQEPQSFQSKILLPPLLPANTLSSPLLSSPLLPRILPRSQHHPPSLDHTGWSHQDTDGCGDKGGGHGH